jgi:hypothetical protein
MARSRKLRLEEVEAEARALDSASEGRRALEGMHKAFACPSYRQHHRAFHAFAWDREGRLKFEDLREARAAFDQTEEARRLRAAIDEELRHVAPAAGREGYYEYRPPGAPEAPPAHTEAPDGPAAAEAAAAATPGPPTGTPAGSPPVAAVPAVAGSTFTEADQQRGLALWFAHAYSPVGLPLGRPPGPWGGYTG